MAQEQSLAWLMEHEPDRMTSLSFVLDSKLAGKDIFTLNFQADGKVDGTYEQTDADGTIQIEHLSAQRPSLRDKIASLHIENWNPQGYFPRQMIMDGWSWSLEITFEGYAPFVIEGSNELPENFQKLRSLFLRFFEKDYLSMLESLPDSLLIERASDLYHAHPEFDALWKQDPQTWFENNEFDATQEELAFMTKVREIKRRNLDYEPSPLERDIDYQIENNLSDIKRLVISQKAPEALRESFSITPSGEGISISRTILQDTLPIAKRTKEISHISWDQFLDLLDIQKWAHPAKPKTAESKLWSLLVYFNKNPQNFILRNSDFQPENFQDVLILINQLFLG